MPVPFHRRGAGDSLPAPLYWWVSFLRFETEEKPVASVIQSSATLLLISTNALRRGSAKSIEFLTGRLENKGYSRAHVRDTTAS